MEVVASKPTVCMLDSTSSLPRISLLDLICSFILDSSMLGPNMVIVVLTPCVSICSAEYHSNPKELEASTPMP